jgi:hypothetical protein
MTEQNIPENGPAETRKTFAYVVDGEVGFISHIDNSLEFLVALLSSNPTVVQIPDDLKYDVNYDWTYDGVTFNPPVY